ncbi:DUF1924 domain-containing protein [Caenimonas koreensis]|uniref:DUF1924 domain-containing protein n=1 Tax=Caenimonas koreensis TaxID=367474 RepID=UPI00378336BE
MNAPRLALQLLAVLAATLALALAPIAVQAATPGELIAGYTAQAGAAPVAARGQQFFNTTHGREWSCGSCHGAVPVQPGKHASTGKPIGALAPAANAERFTDAAKTEKWFRRNCNDVVGRECTAAEKADVMSWLLSLKP